MITRVIARRRCTSYAASVVDNRDEVLDPATLEEIALLGEVIASLRLAPNALSRDQVDELLGVCLKQEWPARDQRAVGLDPRSTRRVLVVLGQDVGDIRRWLT
jgi:hypothetical protein